MWLYRLYRLISSLVGIPRFFRIVSSQVESRSSIAAFISLFLAVFFEYEKVRDCLSGLGSTPEEP
jgi:hypothetical protein